MAKLILWNGRENDSSDPKERLDNLAYRALSEAYRRRFEDAASYLNEVLSENPIHLLGQTVRFYILMGAGDYQGAVAAIDDIFHIMGTPSVMSVESLSQILVLVEKVSGHLRELNAFTESNIMVAGGLWIENMAER